MRRHDSGHRELVLVTAVITSPAGNVRAVRSAAAEVMHEHRETVADEIVEILGISEPLQRGWDKLRRHED